MDGKSRPDAETRHPTKQTDEDEEVLVLVSRQGSPIRRSRLILHTRADSAVTDPAEEVLVLRSRRRRARLPRS